MPDAYTTKAASEATGISRPALRLYTGVYSRYLSLDATPEPGKARAFTEADLRTLAFVYRHTSAQESHEAVKRRLDAGELASFDWQPPDEAQTATEAQEPTSTALVPLERLQASITLLQEAQRREQEAQAKAQALEEENRRLERALGTAHGALEAMRAARYVPPAWLRWLIGGRAEDNK